jgi:dTDP-4-amino-4,6-dideoxygalactose transaminase
LADTYGLRLIYDAAHAFGVRKQEKSILESGDLSVLSFHATKVFNTFEGGAIICRDRKTKQRIDFLKNFGFADELTVVAPGINGKMNEFQAALGLLQLKYVDEAIARRREIDKIYRAKLMGLAGIRLLEIPTDCTMNFSYFPILVGPEFPLKRDDLYAKLKEHGVYSRRYFYPLISDAPMYRQLASAAADNLPVAKRIAAQILCLPIYPALTDEEVERVCDLVSET